MQVQALTGGNSDRRESLSHCAGLKYVSLSPELLIEFCSALCSKRMHVCGSSYKISRKTLHIIAHREILIEWFI